MEAELRWVANQLLMDNGFHQNENIGNLFEAMFKKSNTAKNFTCGETKSSYLAVDALAKEFESILFQEMKTKHFALLLDEKSKGDRSFAAFLVRFLHESEHRAVTACFSVDELQSQTADAYVNLVTEKLHVNDIPLKNLVCVMSDSCATMRGDKGGFIVKLRKVNGLNHIQDLGGCSLHHVHNTVKAGVIEFGEEIESFAKDVFKYFRFNKRHKQFVQLQQSIGVKEDRFLKPVETRWLIMYDVVYRLIEQWDALQEYFRRTCMDDDIDCKNQFHRIKRLLLDTTLIRLYFLQGVLQEFKEFQLLFQSNDCQVHLLYEKMEELITSVMVRFLSPPCMEGKKISEVEYEKEANHLDQDAIIIGTVCKNLMTNLKTSEKNAFFCDVKNFYMQVIKSMLKYFPIGSKSEAPLIRGLSFLQPGSRNDPMYEKRVLNVAKRLPTVISIDDHACLCTEVRRFMIDPEIQSRIDSSESLTGFWLQLKEDKKYCLLNKVACVGLCMPHGNADSERILKLLANNLTPERSCLKELTLHSIIVTKSTMNAFKWRADNMPVTSTLIERGRNARQSYQMRLKLEKEKRDLEERRRAEIVVTEEAKRHLVEMKRSREELERKKNTLEKKKEDARKAITTAQEMLKTAGKDLAMIEKEEKRLNKSDQEKLVSKAVKRAFATSVANLHIPKIAKKS